uniref:Uncharacterized protein n=1 Tax=Hyaloperonospora arabidopsidis (strain Emoy2) TaxID=559515 RepID=M4BKF2_HYAAE
MSQTCACGPKDLSSRIGTGLVPTLLLVFRRFKGLAAWHGFSDSWRQPRRGFGAFLSRHYDGCRKQVEVPRQAKTR